MWALCKRASGWPKVCANGTKSRSQGPQSRNSSPDLIILSKYCLLRKRLAGRSKRKRRKTKTDQSFSRDNYLWKNKSGDVIINNVPIILFLYFLSNKWSNFFSLTLRSISITWKKIWKRKGTINDDPRLRSTKWFPFSCLLFLKEKEMQTRNERKHGRSLVTVGFIFLRKKQLTFNGRSNSLFLLRDRPVNCYFLWKENECHAGSRWSNPSKAWAQRLIRSFIYCFYRHDNNFKEFFRKFLFYSLFFFIGIFSYGFLSFLWPYGQYL